MGRIEADTHCTFKLAVRISALFGTGAVYPDSLKVLINLTMESQRDTSMRLAIDCPNCFFS